MNEVTAVRDASGGAPATGATGSQSPPAVWDEPTAVAWARGGDEPAFDWLYRKYEKPIRVHLFRMLGDIPDAEDLTADTFLKIWLALPKTSADLRFQAWAYRVATNVALDALRHRGLIRWFPLAGLLTALGLQSGPASGSSQAGQPVLSKADSRFGRIAREALTDHDRGVQPEAAAVRREDAEEVWVILDQLPARYRTAMLLRDVRGLSYDQIADALSTSRGTVKSVLFRARAQFRALCARTTRPPGRALELAEARAIEAREAPAISGAEVRRRRAALGFSQSRLSLKMRCHQCSLSDLENLDRAGAGLRQRALDALAKAERERAEDAQARAEREAA